METRHINYKSDFVIRERFRDGTGKVVALPDVDFELRYWVGSHSVKATRKDGVYTGCVPDGDGLLVIFKDHSLGEGELHHELHLALDNALFENGVQNVYYPESLHIWLWDKMGDTEGVVESDCVAAYTRGYKFTWEDFTAADIIVLQKPATEAAERADNNVRKFIEVAQRKNDTAVNNAKAATAATIAATDAAKAATGEAASATAESKKATTAATDATAKATAATAESTKATTRLSRRPQTQTRPQQRQRRPQLRASARPTRARLPRPTPTRQDSRPRQPQKGWRRHARKWSLP